jgi:hypothetical protein
MLDRSNQNLTTFAFLWWMQWSRYCIGGPLCRDAGRRREGPGNEADASGSFEIRPFETRGSDRVSFFAGLLTLHRRTCIVDSTNVSIKQVLVSAVGMRRTWSESEFDVARA